MADDAAPHHHLRPLLPAPPGHDPSQAPPLTNVRSVVPKSPKVPSACAACRKRKSRCTGGRPACKRCVDNKIDCIYDADGSTKAQQMAIKRKLQQSEERLGLYDELFQLLGNLPDQDVQPILLRIRNGADVASVLSSVKSANILIQMALIPETRKRYSFPYISDMPSKLLAHNPYLNSLIFEAETLYSNTQAPESSTNAPVTGPSLAEYQSPYLMPIQAAEFMDAQLSSAKLSFWTKVSANDALMREILAVFLRAEYTFQTPFPLNYFFQDMATENKKFCSSLLVNAVMAYACICYPRFDTRAQYWNPSNLGYQFLAEAKRLWELEAMKPRLATIQAAVCLTLCHNTCGLDKIGQAYSTQAVTLAQELKLFDSMDRIKNQETKDRRIFTAWMLYNFETLTAYHFIYVPLLQKPPIEPLPDPLVNPRWYGELWLKYPLSQSLSPINLSHLIREKSSFRIIMNEATTAYFKEEPEVTLERAKSFHSRLNMWYSNLPECLHPRYITHPGHFQLHFHYHNLLMTIYEPLISDPQGRDTALEAFSSANKYFETLIRIYYLRHGFMDTNVFICQPLTLIGFMCIEALAKPMPKAEAEAYRSTLMLVAKGLYEQQKSHFLARTLFLVVKGGMEPNEANLMASLLGSADDANDTIESERRVIHSQWPVSVIRKPEKPGSKSLTKLVEEFAKSTLGSDCSGEESD